MTRSARQRVVVDGRTAFISGAASGIGRAMAVRLSAHGCPLAIVDQDRQGLEDTERLLSGPALIRQLDVRDRQSQLAFAAEVAQWAPRPLGMVFNNAGVAASQSIAEAAVEDDEWVLSINVDGVVNGVRAFLPILLEQDSGIIVNASSAFGLVGMAHQSAYCASKFAVRGFTDSLRQELRGTGVRAATVHPGGIKTNIVRNSRYHAFSTQAGLSHADATRVFDRIARTTPERAAEVIHNGAKAGKGRILVGPDAYAFDLLARLMPSRYPDVIGALEPMVLRRAQRGT